LWILILIRTPEKHTGVTKFLCRASEREEVIRELEKCKTDGEQYYAESGNLFAAVGVLRAADIFWARTNPVLCILKEETIPDDSAHIIVRPCRG
jgi:hypothetical protein